jgi:glutathione peroxidase
MSKFAVTGLVIILAAFLVVWGIKSLNRQNKRAQAIQSLKALAQAQHVYADEVDQVFDVQSGQLPEETFEGVPEMNSKFHSFTMNDIDGRPVPLSQYQGKVLLVVNVASQCGYTKQYADLQQLYDKYKDRGFVILGFPANNFGGQEPGTDAEIKNFCTTRFNVTFPMFSKISVKGQDIHPLYQYLTDPEQNGQFGKPIKWNFNKFLVDKYGNTIGYFESKTGPLDPAITDTLEKALDEDNSEML